MANDTKIRITADASQAEGVFNSFEKTTGSVMGRVGRLIAGALSVGEVLKMANEFTNLQNRMRLVTSSSEELANVTGKLFDTAQRTRQGFAETVDMYTRMSRASGELGLNQAQLLGLTETVNNAILVSGASTAEASSGVMQFAQALASGRLQGDELRSILENMPRLAEAIAKGLGVTVGELRNMGSQGQLTAETVANAVLSQSAIVNKEAGSMAITMDQAMTQAGNALQMYVAYVDKATGATNMMAEAVSWLAQKLGELAAPVNLKEQLSYTGLLAEQQAKVDTLRHRITEGGWGETKTKRLMAELMQANAMLETMIAHRAELDKPVGGGTVASNMPTASPLKLESFLSDNSVMDNAQKKQVELNDLMVKFAEAVKGYSQDSTEYLSAYEALQVGINNIDDKYKKKDKKGSKFDSAAFDSSLFNEQMQMLNASAEQIKVYDLARKASIDVDKLSAAGKHEEAAALRAALDVRLEDAQQRASQITEMGLAKQGATMDPVAIEQQGYDNSLEAARAYHEQMNTEQSAYAQMREMIEADHQAKLVDLGRKGALSRAQFEKLSGKQQVQIVSGTMQDIIGASAEHSIAMFNMIKAARLAEAAVTLPSTVMKAYDAGAWGGPPLSIAYAGLALSAQLINLNAIKSAQFGGGGGGSAAAGGGTVSSVAVPGQVANPNVVSAGAAQSSANAQPQVINNFYNTGTFVDSQSFNEATFAFMQDKVSNSDALLIDPRSRQAQVLSGATA